MLLATSEDVRFTCLTSCLLREDEYDVNFVYGADATNVDITKRHIEPIVKKALEGYNTCVIAFGATGGLRNHSIKDVC